MTDASDMELLREYDRQGSEAAFAEVVRRQVNLVYSTALRHVGIAAHAEEITQVVFVVLARKCGSLRPDTALEGWLYETTRLISLSFLRGERRRQFREQAAYMESNLHESQEESVWPQLAPLLDEAMMRLGKKDREALVLRYFKEKNVASVAAALQVSEAAAQRRVHRAVEKLRRTFAKRGIVLPAAMLTAAIAANSVHAAPATLAKFATAAATTKGAAASGSTLTLSKGALKVMAWTKAKTTAVAGLCLLLILAGGTALVVSKKHSTRRAAPATTVYNRGDLKDPAKVSVLTDLRAKVWPAERAAAEAQIKLRQQQDDTAAAVKIDLKPYINTALTDAAASLPGYTGNNFAELPSGAGTYGGVPFDVEGFVQLDGTNFAQFKKNYPAEAGGIRINRRCARIYVLHGAHWIYLHDLGKTVAKLVLHYEDGTAAEIEIVAGRHVFDAWSPLFSTGADPRYSQMAPGSERAWTGSNALIRKIWPDESLILYRSAFDNPHPEKAIATLDYVSTVTGMAPFLAGLTVE